MAAPKITIEKVSRNRISKNPGVDSSTVSFSTNQDLVQWEARADGRGVGQGLLVGSGGALSLGNNWRALSAKNGAIWSGWGRTTWEDSLYKAAAASFVVDDEELTNGDKPYQINVYGKNQNGEWNAYGQ